VVRFMYGWVIFELRVVIETLNLKRLGKLFFLFLNKFL
jgi:hypothetical protein